MKKNSWELAEALVNESGYSPAVSLAIDALEEKAPDCLGDTKEARDLILALMDQAGFQVPVQKKVAGIIGLGSRAATVPDHGVTV